MPDGAENGRAGRVVWKTGRKNYCGRPRRAAPSRPCALRRPRGMGGRRAGRLLVPVDLFASTWRGQPRCRKCRRRVLAVDHRRSRVCCFFSYLCGSGLGQPGRSALRRAASAEKCRGVRGTPRAARRALLRHSRVGWAGGRLRPSALVADTWGQN